MGSFLLKYLITNISLKFNEIANNIAYETIFTKCDGEREEKSKGKKKTEENLTRKMKVKVKRTKIKEEHERKRKEGSR